jgi:predicted phage terminase large subunit-like protein
MNKFKGLEKKVDVLERKIASELLRRQDLLLKSQSISCPNNKANSILDKEMFKQWFYAYKLEQKGSFRFPDNEELLWNQYKTTILDNPWIRWKPLVTENFRSPQTEFLLCNDLEVFYGGSGGGGKSVALLAGALQYVDQPEYDALLLRRKITDLTLPGALIDLAHQWLDDTRAKFDSKNNSFVFPSGSRLAFGYCGCLGDEQRYRSAQFQYIGIDELTQWLEKQYQFMFSRLRKTRNLGAPLRMRSASNPGDIGHAWVKDRFITEHLIPDRVFIPAKLTDNPVLDQEAYIKSLMNLDPITRAQILNGDWEISPNDGIFKRGWFTIVDDFPKGKRTVRYWDKAATMPERGKDPDWTVGVKATLVDGVFYVIDVVRFRGTPQLNESTIHQTAELDGRRVDIYMEQEPGSSGVSDIDNYARKVLLGYTFRPERTTGSKQMRANPLSSAAERGNVKVVKGFWNRDFLDEFELFPYGSHDDIVDSASGAFGKLTEHVPLGGGMAPSIFGL